MPDVRRVTASRTDGPHSFIAIIARIFNTRANAMRADFFRPWSAVLLGIALSGLLAACASTGLQRGAPHPLTSLPTTQWPTNGGDYYNRRYSPLEQIDTDNVAGLRGVWRTHLNGSGIGPQYSGEAQPLVVDDVIYVITGADDVFALSVATGEILWSYEAGLDPNNSAVCCGWTSRGVGHGDGRIYVGQLDGRLVALDAATGDVVWNVQAERWQEGFSITSAPLYYDGLVITGFSGGERGIRGRVKAYDAATGELEWTFYTVPGPGEVGHETWPQDNDFWMDGGAPVWQTPAVDPELGLIYFSTGNPGPDYNGSLRAGDNLFSASIVALDARTGEYEWHFQQVHHDIWDYDAPAPVVLFDITLDGRLRKGLAQASKTGWVYILDRTNGEPLIGIEERPVPQEPRQATARTQPYPVGDAFSPQSIPIAPEGFELVNQGRIFTPFWTDEPVVIKPGVGGGANWPPSSYDPESGYLYVCARDGGWAYVSEDIDDERPEEGAGFTGGGFGGPFLRTLGIFAALDMHTNRLVWRQHWPEPCYSGSLTTAGGLVFVGRSDGRLTALDSGTGTQLWEFQTGAGLNAPATTFEYQGTQYVVALSAGNLFAGSVKGDSVWLFALDGDLEQVAPGLPARPPAPPPPPPEPLADLRNGASVYQSICAFCHGDDGRGGTGGGVSLHNMRTVEDVTNMVNEGRNMMPSLAGALSEDQIRDVAAYVIDRFGNGD
jgi:alcohol dehydrogenase (cytochrome c)